MLFGANEPAAHPSGRAAVPSHYRGGLTASSTGLMPNAQHSGIVAQTAALHHRVSVGPRAGERSDVQHPHSRRHYDPHAFTNLSDAAKREEGRYGRAHVASEQQKRVDAYYATKQASVAQPPGTEANLYLKSYYYTPLSKADRTSPPPRTSVTGGFRMDAQSTSFQLAEARLRRLRREHPEYRAEVDQVLKEQHGDYGIVKTQEKLSRKAAVADYAEDTNARVQQIEATTKYHGTPNLGSPAPSIERSIPYALSDSHGRKDTQLNLTSHVRLFRARNRSSSPTEAPVKPCDRHLHEGPIPYDSADLSKERYPSPPPIGVRQGIYAKPPMVHIDARHNRQCGEDVDTLALKRARGRSGASQSQERPQADHIFGPGPALHSPKPTLSQRTEARWKAQERNGEERRTGRALYPQSYSSTALW